MGIRSFVFDRVLAGSFADLGYRLYQGDGNRIPPSRKEVLRQLSPDFPFYRRAGNAHRHFLAAAGGRIVGRISAMVNRDLRDPQGRPLGTVGFFECAEDYGAARDLFDAAVRWITEEQKIGRVWGPVNFDIWHGYRLMTRGFDQKPFLGEPCNKPWYPDFFLRYGFAPLHAWDSLEVRGKETLARMAARGLERHRLLLKRGYRFRRLDPGRFAEELETLHGILTRCFALFPGFTPIDAAEFSRLLAPLRRAIIPDLFIFAHDECGHPAGFTAAFPEISDAVRAAGGKDTLLARLRFLGNLRRADRVNFFLGGITPEEQAKGSGLGRAGFALVVEETLKLGYQTLLLTLRMKGSFSRALPGTDVPRPQREYALYRWPP